MGTSRLTAYYARALPGRRDGDIAPYRHYTREIRMRIRPAHYARAVRTRITRATR